MILYTYSYFQLILQTCYSEAVLVAQLCLTLHDPTDCSLPRFSVHEGSVGRDTWIGLPFPSPGIHRLIFSKTWLVVVASIDIYFPAWLTCPWVCTFTSIEKTLGHVILKPCWVLIWSQVDYQWIRQLHPTPVLLPGKSHGRRSLVSCSPWGR